MDFMAKAMEEQQRKEGEEGNGLGQDPNQPIANASAPPPHPNPIGGPPPSDLSLENMVEEEITWQGGKKTNEESSAHAQSTVVKREDEEASENRRQGGEIKTLEVKNIISILIWIFKAVKKRNF